MNKQLAEDINEFLRETQCQTKLGISRINIVQISKDDYKVEVY